MQPNSPKPSYASKAASPAGSRSPSPPQETYKPIIRIPPPARLIQGKIAFNKSNTPQVQPAPQGNQEANAAESDKANAQEEVTNNSTADLGTPTTRMPEIPIAPPSPQETKLDKRQAKKAKKARQAAAKAAAKATIASSSKEEQTKLNEVGETTCNPGRPDDLSSISSDPFVQNASPAPSITQSTPRYTATEKGKGRAHALSQNLLMKTTPEATVGTSHTHKNPNKRKAIESPAAHTKVTKRNTNMANPPLHTPLRLTINYSTNAPGPSVVPEHELLNSHPITLPTELGPPPPQTPPESLTSTRAADTLQPPLSNNLDIFSRLPSIIDIKRELEAHLKLKPAFCGTEKEFNEHTMRLQELLAAITAMSDHTQSPSRRMYVRSYQIPLPPQRHNPTNRDETVPDTLLTPTPPPRQRTVSHAGTTSSHYPNPGFPLRSRRSDWTLSPPPVNSDRRSHLPFVSPMDDEEDGVSIVDSVEWPVRGQSPPASDIWEDGNVPPPYASSRNETPPHQPLPNPNYPRSPSVVTVTEIVFDPSNDMQIDANPLFLWLPADIPGMVVNSAGLLRLERPQGGWIRTEYWNPPTHCLSDKSLATVADVPPHALWMLMYRANGKNLEDQDTVDAIRENIGKLIVVPPGTRLGLKFMTLRPKTTQVSRFELPHHILLDSITPSQSQYLLDLKALISPDLICWFLPLIPPKTHFAGTIVGLHHKKEEVNEVLDTIKAELNHPDHSNLAQYVNINSNPHTHDAYHSLIANLTINFVDVLQRNPNPAQKQPKTVRAWNVILPPNNLNDLSTIGFIDLLTKVEIRTDGAGLGTFLESHRIPLCDGCKGLGHYYQNCPYHELPGWPGSKPPTTTTPNKLPRNWAELYDRNQRTNNNQRKGRGRELNGRSNDAGNGTSSVRGRGRGNNRGSRYNRFV